MAENSKEALNKRIPLMSFGKIRRAFLKNWTETAGIWRFANRLPMLQASFVIAARGARHRLPSINVKLINSLCIR
jgi:hypothetical protein